MHLLLLIQRCLIVGRVTRYGLDGPGIESHWGAGFSAPVQTGPGAHPTSCTMGTGSFPGLKRPEHGADHPPHLALRLRKEWSYTLLPLWAFVACCRMNCTLPLPYSKKCSLLLLRCLTSNRFLVLLSHHKVLRPKAVLSTTDMQVAGLHTKQAPLIAVSLEAQILAF
jgi:hypothetical protein